MKSDKIGELNYNNFGSKMTIIEYRRWDDVDVYFPQYNWTAKNVRYNHFKNGNIKSPYEPRTFGVGYLGEGRYKAWQNGKKTKCYQTWAHMLERCYSNKYHEKYPTYKNCKVYKEWLNYQDFAKWYYENFYEIYGEKMCLDKDILIKHNKLYSPERCVFVPETINNLFTKSDKNRGGSPIGTSLVDNKYRAYCDIFDFEKRKKKKIHLGYYNNKEKAFEAYKKFKEAYIKKIADYYKEQIPTKLYNNLYNYEIEIDD